MRTIVVGVDGSPASLEALGWSDDIARRTGARLVAVRAGLPGRGTVSPALAAETGDRARRDLEAWCRKRELAAVPDLVVTDQDPRLGLVAAATERAADLLAVGARGTTGLAGLFLGGVTHHLAQHPTLPLAIVPADVDADDAAVAPTRHVVVGVDGSDGSLAAVRFSADLASELEVPATAVLAHEPLAEWVPPNDPQGWQSRARRHLDEWVVPMTAAGVPVDLVVDRDVHPVAALCRALDTRAGSIAVVGTRGQGGFAGLRLGRVPLQLLQRASVPVVIVPVRGSR
jgi:nucleotide-binding universal stress UspA family protein